VNGKILSVRSQFSVLSYWRCEALWLCDAELLDGLFSSVKGDILMRKTQPRKPTKTTPTSKTPDLATWRRFHDRKTTLVDQAFRALGTEDAKDLDPAPKLVLICMAWRASNEGTLQHASLASVCRQLTLTHPERMSAALKPGGWIARDAKGRWQINCAKLDLLAPQRGGAEHPSWGGPSSTTNMDKQTALSPEAYAIAQLAHRWWDLYAKKKYSTKERALNACYDVVKHYGLTAKDVKTITEGLVERAPAAYRNAHEFWLEGCWIEFLPPERLEELGLNPAASSVGQQTKASPSITITVSSLDDFA
jgi:hypothetical protein